MLTASVIIPARDAQRTLQRTLQAMSDQELEGGFEVIVVDNGSRDDSAADALRSPVVNRVIRRPRGEGPGAARNAGAEAAGGTVLAFLDADCRPARGWLAAGVAATQGADLVQGRVLPDPEVPLGPFDRTLSVGDAHGLFESANLFVRRELFHHVGGFPAGLEAQAPGRRGAPFGEDVRFGWIARRAGARTGFAPDALAYHEVTPRGPSAYIAERTRLGMFPELAREIPELREGFLYRRWFLNRRSAALDLAVLGAGLALVADRPGALAAGIPYLLSVGKAAQRWGVKRGGAVALVELLADAYGAAALIRGSLQARTPVL